MKNGGRSIKPTEHQIQAAYFDLVRLHYPGTKLIYSVPNGAYKSFSARRKFQREGLTTGMPDVNIDVPRNWWSGMRIEFKRDASCKPSPDQVEAHKQLTEQGYLVEIHSDALKAWERTQQYIRFEIKRDLQ